MSTGGAFFDSNVPLYTLVQGDPRKSVETSLLGTCGSVSVQLLNEFANVGHRKIKLSQLR